ncbi:MAG: tetratricopeptide repeat protein [Phycisphaerales bacterium]|nr:MAG: tetratricopeptide repeat protein [Phycisphaerales bacterium]
MIARKTSFILFCMVFLTLAVCTMAELPRDQLFDLFDQANEAFRQANSMAGDPQAEKLYAKAILSYERIINEGRIENAKLFYNLGNAYFLKEDIGKAILNYRRAERLSGSDADIQKNLDFARSRRIDKITPKTQERVLETLFFWHYDFSLRTKFTLACLFFAAACICVTVMIWLGRTPLPMFIAVISAVLMLCFAASVAVESWLTAETVCGVITAQDVVGRQGDGQSYPESFKDPLHAGTEFDLLEHRPGWFHIELSDGSDSWIPDNSAELIFGDFSSIIGVLTPERS